MTKEEMQDAVAWARTHHPMQAVPPLLTIVAELIARVPEDWPPPRTRAHVHKRFVPVDLTPRAPRP